jgi:RNA polymerase sigma-70 factor (ECF subfamily)
MADAPGTRPSLLVRIRDPRDGQAWAQFVEVYAPLIYGFARKHGLQDADAADLTQEVLRVLPAAAQRLDYDPARGSFRGWLFTVVRNKLRNFTERQRQPRGTGDTEMQHRLAEQPGRNEDPTKAWDQAYQRRVFTWAAEQVRGSVTEATWQAFWQTAVEGKGGKEAAASLGMTVAAVYLAKSRVMARLKEQVRELTEENQPSSGGGS